MDCIIIRGGRPLRGTVTVNGSKNAALAIMAATLLCGGTHTIAGVPHLRDIATMRRLFEHLGCRFDAQGRNLSIEATDLTSTEAPYELVRTMRASFLVLGPLLARFGQARVSLPGGCAIGVRPVDQHIRALEAMGAEVTIDQGYVHARCEELRGAHVMFDRPTVGGTENAMMAAVLARGRTVIDNAASEPEIVDLATALQGMGAAVTGQGTDRIVIEGVRELRPLRYTVMADRIEAGTLMVAAGITGGDILIRNCPLGAMTATVEKLIEAGLVITPRAGDVQVRTNGALCPLEVVTHPHPGFPTDMQAQIMTLLTVAQGTSIIRETVFENRFIHVAELDRMGARIKVEHDTAVVTGIACLQGAGVMATDLRASASLIVAGLAARGETIVSRVYHLDRGYESLERKLAALGADIRREPEPASAASA